MDFLLIWLPGRPICTSTLSTGFGVKSHHAHSHSSVLCSVYLKVVPAKVVQKNEYLL